MTIIEESFIKDTSTILSLNLKFINDFKIDMQWCFLIWSNFSAEKHREDSMSESDILEQIKKLDTSSDKSAEKVIQSLVAIGKLTVPSLIKAAKNKEVPRIRKWSLQALGAIGDKRAAPLLIEALKDKRMTIRLHAVKGLSRMKYKKGVKEIASLLKDESGGVRVNALYALMEIGDASVSSQIQKSLSDPQWYVRQTAAIACGKFGIAKAKKTLNQLFKNDERKAVRVAAAEALANLENLNKSF